MNVLEAHVARSLEKDGTPCAEVQVRTDDPQCEQVLAYFSLSADQDYDLVSIVRDDADLLTDWFDNSMHTAYEDITMQWFENESLKTDWGRRETFKQQVLASGQVREDLRELLG
ncbi:hypothetical protein ACTHPH_00015 [Paenibacillus pasadenensis]|uniref:Uncharacterized protein n=1 Tax=Paenibacillus pasadenensis TaxID=217090 RepID=A0A2N5N9D4_9BACL|nr:hypothetical protein [Paenibacillus pasadenensis]PLT46966.1 hypothetical protein B8V81_1190 [Paenibacillus pasadenensis]